MEIEIMRSLDHPNVVKIFEFYQDEDYFYIVMLLLTGGELFDKIVQKGNFTEGMAAETMHQILSALFYVHHNKIVHRDLKPENILYENKRDDSLLKIVDFGTSSFFDPNKKMRAKSGTVRHFG